MKNISGIYRIVNTVTGDFYLGSSKNISNRWKYHLGNLKRNTHINIILQRAWNKYGESVFIFEIVERCTPQKENLFEIEQKYLDKWSPKYNIGQSAHGGDNISKHPLNQEIRKKISQAGYDRFSNMTPEEKHQFSLSKIGKNNPNFGNRWSPELRKKVSLMLTGKKASMLTKLKLREYWDSDRGLERRKKLSEEASLRYRGKDNPFYGKTHNTDTKNKLSQYQKHRFQNMSEKEKESFRDKFRGENSKRFMGYYHTPWGTFPSSHQAQLNSKPFLFSATIRRYCLKPDIIIRTCSWSGSKYLRTLPKDIIGKTYRDIGFWFEPKQPSQL